MLLPLTCRMCAGCNHDIGYGNYLGCMGAFFHPQCFRCHACGYPITEHEVSRLLSDYEYEDSLSLHHTARACVIPFF